MNRSIERLESRRLLAATLLRDINTDTAGSNPGFYFEWNDAVYLPASDGVRGIELYRSDGTDEGTVLLKDINPGIPSSNPGGSLEGQGSTSTPNMAAAAASLFFTANDPSGTELWKTDGTESGTVMVKDITPGPGSTFLGGLTELNGKLYFLASSTTGGSGLWTSDGTVEGTVLVKPLQVTPGRLRVLKHQGALYFAAGDATTGVELYKSDGTAAATVLVADLVSGPTGSNPFNFTAFNGEVYFSAGSGLYRTNGASATLVKTATTSIAQIISAGNKLFFVQGSSVLWTSDGTSDGTIQLGGGSSTTFTSIANLTDLNGTLFFSAFNTTTGTELYRSDGTVANTGLLVDIAADAASSNPSSVRNVDGKLMFLADHPTYGTELWTSDGTAAGTRLVKDVNPESGVTPKLNAATVINGMLWYSYTDPDGGMEIYHSDATPEGTKLLFEINRLPQSSSPASAVTLNGKQIFVASDGDLGRELWITDGAPGGTQLLADVWPGSSSGVIGNPIAFNGAVYFSGNSGSGARLWKTDGTPAGTMMVAGAAGGSTPGNFAATSNALFFTLTDSTGGNELWKTDGTDAGTGRVKDIFPGTTSSLISGITAVDDVVFFRANDPATALELWKSDGTEAGTVLVKDIYPTGNSSDPNWLTNVNGTLFFVAASSEHGRELWKSNGTAAGTVLVKDIQTGFGSSGPANLINVNGTLFFSASNSATGTELWKSDGTANGTVLVKDIWAGASNGSPSSLTAVRDIVYFVANDGTHGIELWSSNGTSGGTTLVKDINQTGSSSPSGLVGLFNSVYFSADDGTRGREIWESVGTDQGTALLHELNLTGSAAPIILSTQGTQLLVSANDGVIGQELWRVDIPVLPLVADAGGPYAASEGTPITLDARGSSGSIDRFEWDLDYDPATGFNVDATGFVASLPAMDGPATRTVALRLISVDGSQLIDTAAVTVTNVTPVVSAGADKTTFELPGLSVVNVPLAGTFTDPADTHTILWRVTNAAGDVLAASDQLGFTFAAPGEGVYTATLTVTDDDGASASDSATITINNVAPGAGAGPDRFVNEGDTVTLTGNVSDFLSDTHTYVWTVTGPGGQLASATTKDITFTLPDNGGYTATFTVTDNNGAQGSDTAAISASNVSPTLSITGGSSAAEGVGYVLNLSATDPGADTISQWVINWGDGVVETIPGNPPTATHIYADGPARFRIRATASDEDGTYAADLGFFDPIFRPHTGDPASDVLVLPDDRVVVATTYLGSTDTAFQLRRYNVDGTLDTTFFPSANFSSGSDSAAKVALTPDGKYLLGGLVGGPATEDYGLARFNADGSPDLTFGSGGKVRPNIGGQDFFKDMIVQPDGKIIVTANSAQRGLVIVRHNVDGSLDPTFGVGGIANPMYFGSLAELELLPDGKILGVGADVWSTGQASGRVMLVRLTSTGQLDSTFGVGGIVYSDLPGTNDQAAALEITPSGSIYVGGSIRVGGSSSPDFLLARYTATGQLDSSFGTGGMITLDWNGNTDQMYAMELLADGSILTAGTVWAVNNSDSGFARFLPSGALDPMFGVGGKLQYNFSTFSESVAAFDLQSDGKVVAGLSSSIHGGMLLRLLEPGVIVSVQNAGPSAAFANSGPVEESMAATISFTNVTDVPLDAAAGFTFSFDFDNDGTFEISGSTTANETVPAQYLAEGPGARTVRGRVTDRDGGFTDYLTSITIENRAPTATISGPGSGRKNRSISFSLGASDPSAADQAGSFTYSVDWEGDGTIDQIVTSSSTLTLEHTYKKAGNYRITVMVTDEDGATSAPTVWNIAIL